MVRSRTWSTSRPVRVSTLYLLAAGVVGGGGCLAPAPPGSGSGRGLPPEPGSELPKSVTSVGLTARWQETSKDGVVRPVLVVQAETGDLDAVTQSGKLFRAEGTFFREGKARARFRAPVVEASHEEQTVVASNGAVVRSVDPPGAEMRCDRATWLIRKDQIRASGNVWFTHKPLGAAVPSLRGGPIEQVTFQTDLQTITIP